MYLPVRVYKDADNHPWSGFDSVAGFCEHGDRLSCSVTGRGTDFLSGLVGDHQVLKSAPRG
jgi:hypothetical protein